ncbi:hypothetical protein BDW59DRAFT_156589 [Aspergillus cavernicola]|uniref:MYND-type domain-containing protein n=1 Tax=Aspergillus cavernicola TaxID=176166 RepID=A0ABR4J411_9EURO
MASPGFVCANWAPDNTDCKKAGRYTCKNCLLVIYCGATCQKTHWPQHKFECKSPLGKATWQPAWVLENRMPAFIGQGLGESFGDRKYLWGNVPAFDVLQLESNEGDQYSNDLRVLFAASGDLRNIVTTIAHLPSSYSHYIEMTINDRDFDIVARNIILLLIALVVPNSDEAVDCIIHIWYSVLIRESDNDILQHQIRPLIEDVCMKIRDIEPEQILGKTWKFGQRSLSVVLEKSSWNRLLSFMDVPASLNAQQAQETRTVITLAESRTDYRDRYMYCLSSSQRIAFNKFREDGLLLPFGFPRHDFRVPNPTFFQTADIWPMPDNADPRHGWSLEEVVNISGGAATADMYGKLFFYLRGMLKSFLNRLLNLNASFKLLHLDAASLPEYLEADTFSRIEVSNISDYGWIGIHRTLGFMTPLLQTPLMNPHATLITLFMNAVEEAMTNEDRLKDLTPHSKSTKKLLKYLPPIRRAVSKYDPSLISFNVGRDITTTYDHIFDRYTKEFKFHEVAEFLQVEMKDKHTIIEKWPYRLKLQPGQPKAQEEFDRCLVGGMSSKERYVEWKRTG